MAKRQLDSPRRVLIVCQHFWPESFRINDIADYFIEQGHEVDVLCGLPNYPKGQFVDGYGYFRKRHETHKSIRIDRVLEIKRGSNSNLRILLNYVSYPFFSLFHVPKLLFRHYDQIFIYQLSPVIMALPGILIGKIRHIPITMYVLDLWPANLYSVLPIKNWLLKTIAERHSHWYYKRADRLIALSDRMQKKLAEVSGKKPESIVIIPQACEEIYEKRLADTILQKRFGDSFNIVFTGNISPAQSFNTMLDAAELLVKQGLSDIRWIIVGDGMSRQQVEASVKDRHLDECFVFEGQKPLEDMPKYAAIADCFVGCLVKSDLLEATIPAKVMSYIASAKPMALAMDGEVQTLINETIRGGFAGPAEDSRTLAANIRQIYELSPEERQNIEKRLKNYHSKHFKRSLVFDKLHKFVFNLKPEV